MVNNKESDLRSALQTTNEAKAWERKTEESREAESSLGSRVRFSEYTWYLCVISSIVLTLLTVYLIYGNDIRSVGAFISPRDLLVVISLIASYVSLERERPRWKSNTLSDLLMTAHLLPMRFSAH